MKRILATIIILSLLLSCVSSIADGMGVQVIGGSDTGTQSVSLDDIKLEATVEVPGWGDITPLGYYQDDCVMVRKPGQLGRIWIWSSKGKHQVEDYNAYFDFNMEVTCKLHGSKEYPWWCEDWVVHYQSQSQADFGYLTMDILNTTAAKVDYLKDCAVKVVFDDTIEYEGWCYQLNLDLNRCTWLDKADNFGIDPYYIGHYVFGCTLPNTIFSSKKPLRMEITIDGNEITYNIRK